MADLTIDTKVKVPQSVTAPDDLTIEKKGSVAVSFKGEYDSKTMTEYAVYSSANGKTENTIVLNGSISITDKTGDPEGVKSSHKLSGLMIEQKATTGASVYTANIETDNASTIKVTRTTDSEKTINVYGILATFTKQATADLVFTSEQFLDAVTVSATNTNKEGSGYINAYGIRGNNNIKFEGDIAAAISTTSTSFGEGDISASGITASNILTISGDITKSITSKAESKNNDAGRAMAYGIQGAETLIEGELAGSLKVTANSKAGNAYAWGFHNQTGNLAIDGGISKDISVTAKSNNNTATAVGIYTQRAFTIGTEDDEADLAGNITVKGTGANKRTSAYIITTVSGINAAGGITIYGNITKNVTATAENKNKESGTATAYGINSDEEVTINGILSGAVKASATAKADAGNAYGISGKTVNIGEGVAKDITATATVGTQGEAYAIHSTTTEAVTGITIGSTEDKKGNENAIAGNLTAKITGSGTEDITAAAIVSTNSAIMIDGNITKAITATAENKDKESGTATAYGINSGSSVTIDGTISGAVKATATAKADAGNAYGISGKTVNIVEGVAKDITATATGSATDEANVEIKAIGINTDSTLTIGTEDTDKAVAGAITAKATGNAALNILGTEAYTGNATASGLYSKAAITINGDITKNISATATANSVKESDGTVVSGKANAYGLYAMGNITIGDIKGKITVNAASKTDRVEAYGIFTPSKTLTLDSSLGTITATATGVGGTVRGVCSNGICYTGDVLTGKITATYKTGSATGIQTKDILHSNGGSTEAGTASLTITVTAKNATGLFVSGDAALTLSATKITAKTTDKTDGTARAIASEALAIQNIALTDKTVLTGSVELGPGDDTLILTGQSKITGDVDMGENNDKIQINSGSQIKGNVSNLELFDMIYDGVSNNLAMWEGEEFDDAAKLQLSCLTEDFESIKNGKSKNIVLMKDTDNSSVEWTNDTTLDLYLDGDKIKDPLSYNGAAVVSGDFSFKLEGIEKGKTTTMQLTVTKLA